MAAALSSVGLWVLDCLDWWCSLLSVTHEVFTQARCPGPSDHPPHAGYDCVPKRSRAEDQLPI